MQVIPFDPALPHQRVETALGGVNVAVCSRWNSRENAHYLDVYDGENKVISYGLKVVLGVVIGARVARPFFSGNGFIAIDDSGEGRDPGLDELGGRVTVAYVTRDEVELLSFPLPPSVPPGST